MVTGRVTDLHAMLPVTFVMDGQPNLAIDFVVDTGYTGYLSLPPDAVAALKLSFQFETPAILADGSSVLLDVHQATILWNGEHRVVRVVAMTGRPLLGTSLLAQTELVVQFAEGGIVSVDQM